AGRRYGLPVMVHTGMGIPFASPVNLIPLAKEYADVKIIVAHCGQTVLANEAEVAFGLCPNLFGETSWTPGFMVKKWIGEFGHRFMLGSDQANNAAAEIKKYETLGLSTEDRKAIYSETALAVFQLGATAAQGR
ncbi:MAG: amidohydrolase family protein, partial [Spirochaetales bacterium]|nr:amidohydrolase family protein [Spirochaetales bacterium]